MRTVILIEALDHTEAAMHTAVVAADLNRPLLAPPATEDIRADGSARLLAEQRAVLEPATGSCRSARSADGRPQNSRTGSPSTPLPDSGSGETGPALRGRPPSLVSSAAAVRVNEPAASEAGQSNL
ncbi:hypothetical protein OK006_6484 [Actinobacteria bacterium OK006]|nr:hypothetical protein OK006_6484 [Actinobacteria bacterium OK006]